MDPEPTKDTPESRIRLLELQLEAEKKNTEAAIKQRDDARSLALEARSHYAELRQGKEIAERAVQDLQREVKHLEERITSVTDAVVARAKFARREAARAQSSDCLYDTYTSCNDYQREGELVSGVAEELTSELATAASGFLAIRHDLNKSEALAVVDNFRWLVEKAL